MKHEFKLLNVWIDSRELNKIIYRLSLKFPKEENYGLTSQIRRASISISSNIAEGSSFESNKMFAKFLAISLGSLCEVESQLYLAYDLRYLSYSDLSSTLIQVDILKRKLISFTKRIEKLN